MHTRTKTRHVAILAAGIAVTLVLASCGSSSGSDASTTPTTSQASTVASSTPAAGTPDNATGESGANSSVAASTGGLVIDGEQIADDALLAKAKAEGSMTIYTAYTAAKEQVIVDAFTKATGLEVNVVGLGTAALVTRLQSESGAGRYTADIAKLGNLVNMDKLAQGDLLATYSVPAAFKVPESAKNGNGKYWAWNQSPLAPGYNTALVNAADAPKSWKDLLDPKWKGKLGLAPLSAGGVEIATYQFLRNEVDPDFWTKLAAQQPSIMSVMASVTQGVTQGSVQVAIVQPSVLGAAISAGAKVAFVADPPEGLPLSSNFVATANHAPHPAAAQLYLNFLFSKAGQSVISQSIGDYGIRTDVPPPKVAGTPLPALDSGFKFFPLDSADVIKNGPAWTDEWNKTFNYSG